MKTALDDVLEAIDLLDPEEAAQLRKDAYAMTAGDIWVPNFGPQTAAVDSDADELFYGGQAGGGKALSVDELVVTPFGFRRMGDLKVGDTICGADGAPTKVIGVFPQGVRPLYRVMFQDGVSVLADADHRWNYSIAKQVWSKSQHQWKVGTTAQLATMMEGGCRPLIPLCRPLKFTKAYKTPQRIIPPYVLGLLLGDGYTKQSGPGAKWAFASNDPELIAALPGEWVHETGPNYRLRGSARKWLMAEYDRMGLAGCGSRTKFVPEPYKWASADDRLALLQGLMDTDGTNDERGHASFTSISPRLADDVAWLVRSLGGRATISEKPTAHELAFTVYIRTADSADLFRLQRKRDRGTKYQHGDPKRRIESIVYETDGEAVCIAVDNPDSLYVVGVGCIVTHNTDLLCGLSLTEHDRSLILRRLNSDTSAIVDRMAEIIGNRSGLNNSSPKVWRRPDGRVVEIGGCQWENDKQKYKGRPHDLIGFDEISDFSETQFRFIIGWNRSAKPGQRCRVVCTGNPPTTPEGLWVLKYWGAWLDPTHPNPAKDGELRWYTTIGGQDVECDGPEPIMVNGELVKPVSRTFIRSRLSDNPDLASTNYDSKLAALPSELRDAYRDGRFDVVQKDKAFQLIPTEWIKLAQSRWSPEAPGPMSVISNDVALGGGDANTLARRHGFWFDEVISEKLPPMVDPILLAMLVIKHMRDGCPVVIDMGGGYGSGVYSHLHNNVSGIKLFRHNGSNTPTRRSRDGKLEFYNMRAQVHWLFREALEPGLGFPIALPPDPELLADLSAPTWKLTPGGIKVEEKETIAKRLGRSPDKGDAVLNAWSYGEQGSSEMARRAMQARTHTGGAPKVNVGRMAAKRARR